MQCKTRESPQLVSKVLYTCYRNRANSLSYNLDDLHLSRRVKFSDIVLFWNYSSFVFDMDGKAIFLLFFQYTSEWKEQRTI